MCTVFIIYIYVYLYLNWTVSIHLRNIVALQPLETQRIANEPDEQVYLHGLCVGAFSGDNAFFVHKHLSESAHFLPNLFLCVPE